MQQKPQEISHNSQLVSQITQVLKSNIEGVTIHDLIKIIEDDGGDTKLLNQSIQFLQKNRFITIQTSGDLQILKYQDPKDLRHLMEQRDRLTPDEYKVYECVYNSKKRGVEKKEIENATNIFTQLVTKVIKNLEKYNLIKGIKGVKQRTKKKVYVQFNIEFDNDTDGASIFLKEGKIDEDLIRKYTNQIIEEIDNNKRVSLDKISSTLRVIDSNLDNTSVKRLVNLLIFDDVVEEIKSDFGGESLYQLCNWNNVKSYNIENPPLSRTPCGNCEVLYECRPGGVISPETCIYFDKFADW